MTITIRELAAELDVSERTVEVHVNELIDIDGRDATIERTEDLTNSSGRIIGTETYLTDDAADAVRGALVAQDETAWDEPHLSAIADAVAEIEAAKAAQEAATDKRDAAIRRAIAADVKRSRIWETAKIKEARMYQIKDGRR